MNHPSAIGELVRSWRSQRRLSQLALAADADISQKHLSFIESGRSAPSRDMVLHLAEQMEIPLRDRNALLLAAGYAPVFQYRPLTDPSLVRARTAIDLVLKAHEPYPAFTVDRHWTMISANAGVAPLLSGVDPELIKPPVNVMRLSLHPRGLAPLTLNHAEWREHLLGRLQRQFRLDRDPATHTLLTELSGYPVAKRKHGDGQSEGSPDEIAVPLRLRTHLGVLSFFSTITVFGTPVEITLSELSMEAFYPLDAATASIMQAAYRQGSAAAGGVNNTI
ncbi:MAG: helix-turn-helix transcriptional regulator [Alphaproteobacteria bacterium]